MQLGRATNQMKTGSKGGAKSQYEENLNYFELLMEASIGDPLWNKKNLFTFSDRLFWYPQLNFVTLETFNLWHTVL